MENENNISGGKLICEVCNVAPYDTTDKHTDGEVTLVCFKCKDAILTERNTGRDFESDFEGEDFVGITDVKVIDTNYLTLHLLDDFIEADNAALDYEQQMLDRFGGGGRF